MFWHLSFQGSCINLKKTGEISKLGEAQNSANTIILQLGTLLDPSGLLWKIWNKNQISKQSKIIAELKSIEKSKHLGLYAKHIKLLMRYAVSSPNVKLKIMQTISKEEMSILRKEHKYRMVKGNFASFYVQCIGNIKFNSRQSKILLKSKGRHSRLNRSI